MSLPLICHTQSCESCVSRPARVPATNDTPRPTGPYGFGSRQAARSLRQWARQSCSQPSQHTVQSRSLCRLRPPPRRPPLAPCSEHRRRARSVDAALHPQTQATPSAGEADVRPRSLRRRLRNARRCCDERTRERARLPRMRARAVRVRARATRPYRPQIDPMPMLGPMPGLGCKKAKALPAKSPDPRSARDGGDALTPIQWNRPLRRRRRRRR